jgi:hypothetical protein
MEKKIISLSVMVFVLCACTTTETILKNDKGDTRYCYVQNDRTISSIGAVTEYSRCVNEAGAAGYRKVN